MAPSHAWNPDRLAAAMAPLLPGMAVEVVEEIDSSNTELMRRGRAGQLAPVLLVAERQTAGRGRLGRPWQSAQQTEEPASLTFSMGLPLAPRDWSGLSLAVGVSVAESLDAHRNARLALKWPNDLWVDDRKLGGILIETALPQAAVSDVASRWLVIGIGLNIGPREAAGLSTAPAWVRQWLPEATPSSVLQMLVVPLLRDVLAFEAQGFALFAERFAARDALQGREVQLSDGTVGRCEGVGWGGELRVHTEKGMQSISSSEVSVRPRGPAA
ncbi:MAG: biotin--acetyl-CoA-carboxylase ligase [Variovorax sp.]|nr:biotin--acetyl-CoA-carboxylase ligase [Variovorax sp.]